MLSSCLDPANAATEGGGARPESPLPETFPVCAPEGPRVPGGSGTPRVCQQLGSNKCYHDAGGLCSPGRWLHHARSCTEGKSWDWLRMLELVLTKVGGEVELESDGIWWG